MLELVETKCVGQRPDFYTSGTLIFPIKVWSGVLLGVPTLLTNDDNSC
jgi:hypothetical protein